MCLSEPQDPVPKHLGNTGSGSVHTVVNMDPGGKRLRAQSRQSAKFFLQLSELGLPQPLTRRRVCPPPRCWGEGHTRWLERGWDWESPNSDEGTYTVVLFIYTVGTLWL
jgi:hypothetical protein